MKSSRNPVHLDPYVVSYSWSWFSWNCQERFGLEKVRIIRELRTYLVEDDTERYQTRFATFEGDFRESLLHDARQFFQKFSEAARNPLKKIYLIKWKFLAKLIDPTAPRIFRFASINHVFSIYTAFWFDKIPLKDSFEGVDVANCSCKLVNYYNF